MIDPKLTVTMTVMVTLTPSMMDHGKELLLKPHHSLLHKPHCTLMNFLSRLSLETELLMTDPKLMDTTIKIWVMSTPNTMDNGQVLSLNKKLLLLPHHRTHYIPTNSHSRLSQEIESRMTDPKLTDIMIKIWVTLTPNTMDNGKEPLPNKKLLHSLPHRTHCTPMSFHSRLFPEIESPMIDPKHMDITTRI